MTTRRYPLYSSLLLSSLELSEAQVIEPSIRALLGTALHFFEEVVLRLKAYLVLVVGAALELVEEHRERSRYDPPVVVSLRKTWK